MAAVAIGALVGAVWGLADRPLYAATATVVVADRGDVAEELGAGALGGSGPAATERLLEFGRSADVATAAASRLGGDLSGADVLARTTFRGGEEGGTLVIRSTASFPDLAAAAANAFAEAVVETAARTERRRLERAAERLGEQIDAAGAAGRLELVNALQALGPPLVAGREAELPTEAVEDRSPGRWALLGAGLAAALAALAALFGARRGRRPVRSLATATAAAGAPGLATVGSLHRITAAAPARIGVPASLRDQLAGLAVAGGPLAPEHRPLAVAIVPASHESLRGSLALGLAAILSGSGATVLLMEANLRSPSLAARLGVAGSPGLSDYLAGAAGPREVMRPIAVDGGAPAARAPSFVLVPAGAAERSAPLSAPAPLGGLLERLQRIYDVVVIDAPPLGEPDAAALAGHADSTLIAAGPGIDFEPLRAAAATLPGPADGVVLVSS